MFLGIKKLRTDHPRKETRGQYSNLNQRTRQNGHRCPNCPKQALYKAIKYIFYLAIFLFNGAESAEDFFEICAGGAKQNTETPKLRKIRIINLETQEP